MRGKSASSSTPPRRGKSASSSIPPRKRMQSRAPRLRTTLRAHRVGGRNLGKVRSPKLFDRRARQRRPNPKVEAEELAGAAKSLTAGGEMSQEDLLEMLKDEQNGGDFMTLDDAKKVKPADRWYVNCRDRAMWLPPLRAMATLTVVPSHAFARPGCVHETSSKRGYGYLFFGEGTRRQNGIAQLHMDKMSWQAVHGSTKYGTPWAPPPRSGHVAAHLGEGRIFLYGGEANPSCVKDPLADGVDAGREFVPGDSTQLVFDAANSVWERFQPRNSPGPRYLPSLARLTKKHGHPLCLIGGATASVQKKTKAERKARRSGLMDTSEVEQAGALFQERSRPRFSISVEHPESGSITASKEDDIVGGSGRHDGGEPKEKSFATQWRLANDVWLLDTVSMEWERPEVCGPPPSQRMGHTASETPTGSLFIIGGMRGHKSDSFDNQSDDGGYGGGDGLADEEGDGLLGATAVPRKPEGDYTIYELRTTCTPMVWTCIQTFGHNPKILERALHSACVSPWDKSSIYIFGGRIAGNIAEKDVMLVLNASTNEWTRPLTQGKMPAIRNGHGMAITDSGDSYKMVHGGRVTGPKSSLENREVKMWIVGGNGKTGYENLNVYELSINPPTGLLEERGRWYNQVQGHWNYQRQRMLVKPFDAWRIFVKQRRNEHVLAEHDDVLACRLPKKSSHSFLSLPEIKQFDNVKVLCSLGSSYRQYRSVLKSKPGRNRVKYMSIREADLARKRKMLADEIETELQEAQMETDYLRKVEGREDEKNTQSQRSDIYASLFRNAVFDESSSSRRPKSSPGLSRSHHRNNIPRSFRSSLDTSSVRPLTSYSSRRRPNSLSPQKLAR